MHHRKSIPIFTVAVTACALAVPAVPSVAAAAPRPDVTSRAEAVRVDRVPVPDLGWFDCSPIYGEGAECGTARLPLDYDQPRGATTDVAVLRIPASDSEHRIGSLFVNPGGPGASAIEMAAGAKRFLSPEVMERFDIVGMDPRGVGASSNVQCFKNVGVQKAALAGMDPAFPSDVAETRAYVASAEALGRACSTYGAPLSGSMSTAEVARDMDVVRRALGDEKLTYMGASYGTYLGEVYANLFPDRVRAIAIDGVVDPRAWAGTPRTASVSMDARLGSGDGAWKALQELLKRCGEVGADLCSLASFGEPAAVYDQLVDQLQASPIVVDDALSGKALTMTYPTLVDAVLGNLYAPPGWNEVIDILTNIATIQDPASDPADVEKSQEELSWTLGALRRSVSDQAAGRRAALGFDFPYGNSQEAHMAVMCTDSLNPAKASGWAAEAARADETAPGFGSYWTWGSAPCASSTWTIRDEDAYRGPFTRLTANPVLVVGNYWDPATAYTGAVSTSQVLGNSRLLSSDSWGHTAYGTSACVTGAVDAYLLDGTLPAEGTVCTGDVQPFAPLPMTMTTGPQRELPPVVPPAPGALPRG